MKSATRVMQSPNNRRMVVERSATNTRALGDRSLIIAGLVAGVWGNVVRLSATFIKTADLSQTTCNC